jgi:hypothetical protein
MIKISVIAQILHACGSDQMRLIKCLAYIDYFILVTAIYANPCTSPTFLVGGNRSMHPEKTHDIRQSVDRLFSHEWETRESNPRSSEKTNITNKLYTYRR